MREPGGRHLPATVRRRRAALVAAAAAALAAGVVVGAGSGDDEGRTVSGLEAALPLCPAAIGSSDRRLIGRMLVARLEGDPSRELLARVRRGELGGVILFPPTGTAPDTIRSALARLRSAAREGRVPEPLAMIDQEGGEVKRLPGLPPERAPAELASLPGAAARKEGESTGRALAGVGIGIDLAPVMDVPEVDGAFIALRAFGTDADAVAERALAFAAGLGTGGVAATAKHFPGLGRVVVSTDSAPSEVAGDRAELAAGLRPFEAAIAAGIPLVMTSNATYPAFDADFPASLSRPITTGLLRRRLGFEGVAITDDLGAGALTAAGYDEGDAALAAARAGADLLLFALSDGAAAHAALQRALRRGDLDRDALLASCARVTALGDAIASGSPGPRAGPASDSVAP
jgi:beta-N-acetylhexosaminidase